MSLRPIIVLLLSVILLGCSIPKPLVEQIRERGELRVATRNSHTTYYEGRNGLRGLEYELVTRFARSLGVRVRFIIPDRLDRILTMVENGEVDFAAAGLAATPDRERRVRFTPGYQEVTQLLVYRGGSWRPRKLAETRNGTLEVVAGSVQEELLEALRKDVPELQWAARRESDSEELLYLVKEQLVDYTVAGSNVVALSRRFHPELQVALKLSAPMPLAWAFPHAEDSSLFQAACDFIGKLRREGTLEQLVERYYGHTENLGFVDTRSFRRHIVSRLPTLLPFFRKAETETGIEWQLLAAIGYQESHWNPKAVSPTGVRGVMMLTRGTARQLGVRDRRDPEQSILGGARYLKVVEKKLPQRISEPDRLWLTLAGYNIGFGHLEDARILTQRAGGDPDKWAEVKKHLPLLSQKKYYQTVKHGFARGREPVRYVDNIRGYYELLLWENRPREETSTADSGQLPTTMPAAL
ncbi:MAG TPA: membrane-bound lytic murein transglycosylase MltF [Sedimenticola sp.]|nr:membrane-bound lytic murein transglycosylase MltF [Sedimenticola sp.]